MSRTLIRDIVFILCAVILLVSVGAFITHAFQEREARHQIQLEQKEKTNQHIIDSLVDRHAAELHLVNGYAAAYQHERDSLIEVINTRISKINIVYAQKVDDIPALPADSLLRLLTDDLSR